MAAAVTGHIRGTHVTLRPARPDDRRPIYEWLAASDITHRMFGPPRFPDVSVPTWEEFTADYAPYFFDGSEPLQGRCFIIELDGRPVGQVNHDIIRDGRTELDIWMKDASCTGKGYGPDALQTLCMYLHEMFGCTVFYIAPARRNTPAVTAYAKAGFTETTDRPEWFIPDTDDAVLMVRRLTV